MFAASLLKKSAVANGPIPPKTPKNFLAFFGFAERIDRLLDAVDEVESSRESSESAELLEPERLVLLETLDCEHDKSDADEKMPLSLPEARAVMPPDVVADLEPVGRPTALCPTKVRAVELAKPTCANRLLDRTVADRRTLVVGTLKPTVATVLSAAAATEPRWGRVAL